MTQHITHKRTNTAAQLFVIIAAFIVCFMVTGIVLHIAFGESTKEHTYQYYQKMKNDALTGPYQITFNITTSVNK